MFILYLAVKEVWKSVKIWESYWQKFGGFLFGGDTVYSRTFYYWKWDRMFHFISFICRQHSNI